MSEKEKSLKYILPLIIVVAFVLRLKNIWFGYPLALHPDEPIIVQSALNIISTGNLNPHNFLYPSLNIYLNAFLYKTYQLISLRSPSNVIPEINYYLYGRALNVLFSTATVYVVYDIGKRLFNSWTGLAAACFITASSLHVSNSYTVTVDTSMALWCSLAGLMATLIYTKGAKTAYYIVGGVCTGFAVGCKYTAFPAFLPTLVAHICQERHDKHYISKDIMIAAAVVPFAFLLTTPYALLDYKAFFNALAHQKNEYGFHPGAESFLGISIANYCKYLFTEGYGIIPSILALAGIPLLFRKNRSSALLLLSFPLTLLLFLGLYKVYFPRNVVSLIPFLSLFSGYTVVTASKWCGQQISNWVKLPRLGFASFVCGALIVAISIQGQAATDVNTMRENSLPDTRYISLQWCLENLPAGGNIGREHYTPPLEKFSKRHSVHYMSYCGVVGRTGMIPYLDYMIVSSFDYSRYVDDPDNYPIDAKIYNDFFKRNSLVKEFRADGVSMTGPTIRIYKINHN